MLLSNQIVINHKWKAKIKAKFLNSTGRKAKWVRQHWKMLTSLTWISKRH